MAEISVQTIRSQDAAKQLQVSHAGFKRIMEIEKMSQPLTTDDIKLILLTKPACLLAEQEHKRNLILAPPKHNIEQIASRLAISHSEAESLALELGKKAKKKYCLSNETIEKIASMPENERRELIADIYNKRKEAIEKEEVEKLKKAEEKRERKRLHKIAQAEARKLAEENRIKALHARIAELQTYLSQIDPETPLATPFRSEDVDDITFHIGPTNSGKTYHAFEELKKRGSGIYAAPLRFLAREAYQTLGEALGESQVGLVTGEEIINPEAPIICCTAEMAPMQGDMLLLDECHWLADEQRGSAWTRLICGGRYKSIHLMASSDAQEILTKTFPQATVIHYERLSPLAYKGNCHIGNIPDGSAVVAFSRKAVISIASILHKKGKTVATLYGNMPLDSRRAELQKFTSGEASILCTTDVIGHGVNIPTLKNIIFAETNKFDGKERRSLRPWELAQIAGRAGRYGHTNDGEVYYLTGLKWFDNNPSLIQSSLTPKVTVQDDVQAYRNITKAYLSPSLSDLYCKESKDLGQALELWALQAEVKNINEWIEIDKCDDQRELYEILEERDCLQYFSLQTTWKLINAPLKHDQKTLFISFCNWLKNYSIDGNNKKNKPIIFLHENTLKGNQLEVIERYTNDVCTLRWFANSFDYACPLTIEQIDYLEKMAAVRVTELLAETIKEGTIGSCEECGKNCAPWFEFCDECFSGHFSNRYWDDDW